MSWIFDEVRDLINLDKVSKLSVAPIDEPEVAGPTHCVIAYFDHDELTTWLMSGNEKECNEFLERVSKKMHTIGS